MDIGQSEVAAGRPMSQSLMVESEHVQDGCVQVMHVNLVAYGRISKLIGLANKAMPDFTPAPASHTVNPPGL